MRKNCQLKPHEMTFTRASQVVRDASDLRTRQRAALIQGTRFQTLTGKVKANYGKHIFKRSYLRPNLHAAAERRLTWQ